MHCSEFQRKVFVLLETQTYEIRKLSRELLLVKHLLHTVPRPGAVPSDVAGTTVVEVPFDLPVTTEEELQTLEQRISNKQDFQSLVRHSG